MSTSVEFASKATADSYREDHGEYLCSDDDARKKTVVFASDVPDDVLERAELEALDERGESEAGAGQVQLTDAERDRIDFSAGRASVPHARSAKAIAADEGVDDWTSYYDPRLTVDEHREVFRRAAREDRGRRQEDSETAA